MNIATRKTRACTIDALDAQLRAAIRAHGTEHGLEDIEASVLMCCETITIHSPKGSHGGIKTTLSAVFVTPKWLVWADSSGRDNVAAGAVPLSQIGVREDRERKQYAIAPEQGLNITRHARGKNRRGLTFIVLAAEGDGQKFRKVLDEALRNAAR